ncbi:MULTISPECIES: vWA domain-containing protein [Synechocystis]|uniref:VWA domain-containing protein n=1 Tax=Synechocystis salina LEGE 00031 TaxID=1828736 RepID=A0ABR9VS31_9SYNC|nr:MULTISPECIES: VWA domain-containing protein [Synechocystis]MBD2652118.1 VWA domain-containing protein [Synechocystis sp. FACHB-383]MBE9196196.1 VWA domain-containing protein [Synechocystis sp. LEGE 06083]MBE9240760.1 VWA domain-containing protein [Synechocystis salina LEGE 00041]MBE9254167.1 VWA domain-containing protein [Synechocystis salina LEGE 00031]
MSAEAVIENRDYTLMIDKSSSMATADDPNGPTRWEIAQASTIALAQKCEEIDPDGITVYLFSGRFRRYDNVTAQKVAYIYANNEPMGRTDLASALKDGLDNFFQRRQAGQTKPNGETFLIITDGEPTDRKAVIRLILEASQKIDRDEELGISLIQVGNDKKATAFFQALDDQLQAAGAKFDIVDTVTMEDMQGMSLSDVLLKAITD